MSLCGNNFGEVGWCTIFDTLRDNPQNKISKWDLYDEGIDSTIAKSLAGYAAVSASLTATNLLQNNFDADAALMLLKVKQEHPGLTTPCGFKGDETSINFSYHSLGPADAMLIAPEISVMASLTEVRSAFAACMPTWEVATVTAAPRVCHRWIYLTTRSAASIGALGQERH